MVAKHPAELPTLPQGCEHYRAVQEGRGEGAVTITDISINGTLNYVVDCKSCGIKYRVPVKENSEPHEESLPEGLTERFTEPDQIPNF